MKKMFFFVITSFGLLFLIWTLQIAIKNNFELEGVRFSFKATIMQLEDMNTENFKELTQNIYYAIKTYEIQEQVAQQNIFTQLTLAPSWFGMLGNIILNLIKYIGAEIGMLFKIMNFIFNPITY